MNFLNRQMFQAGGSVTYADGTVDRITVQDFANQLANLSDSELFALRNSSDAGQISLTMDLKAVLDDVTNRKAIPLTKNIGSNLQSGRSLLEDYARTAKGVFLPAVAGISRQLLSEEALENRPRLQALQDYDSPIYGEGLQGAMEAGVRGGRSEAELQNILQASPLDLTSDIDELLEEERQLDEEASAVEDPITLTPSPVTGGETLGRSSDIDIARRQIEFEESMIGRDEFGELLPDERPDFTSQLPSPERTAPVDLPPAVENEIQNALDELEGVTVPELVPETKPSVTFEKPKIDLQNVDTEITIDDLNRERASKLPPRETSGVFGSDRFLDFIRNVGGELARTGQLGEGLASGAAKAAEERAARDLLQEEEARKQTQAKELLKYEASLEALDEGIMDYKEAESIGEAEESIDTAIRNFSGSERTLKDLDAVFKDLEDPNAYGVKGWLTQSMTKLAAAAGMSLGDWKDLDPTTRINTTLDVLAQQSVREILGESGKTISNLDRQIVADIFGNLTIFTQPADIKKRLTRTRNNVIDSMEQDRRAIIRGTSYLARTGQTSPQVTEEKELINKILGIDFNALREPGSYFASEGIIDTTLRPTT
tara:strand:+ start:2369 stop:4171 length:1803 start_codon:yes stop_codon:yes gene_type:complete